MKAQLDYELLATLAHEAMVLQDKPEYRTLALLSSLAHPGFIGDEYDDERGGTLVIGMNRGGSSDSGGDPTERSYLQALQRKPDIPAFQALSRRCFELLPQWNVWSRNLILLLSRLSIPVSRVAYIHAVPFRVPDNELLDGLYLPVWQEFTNRQVSALRPKRILFAGKKLGKILGPVVSVRHHIVPRTGKGDIAYPNHHGVAHAKAVAQAHDVIATDAQFWSTDVQ